MDSSFANMRKNLRWAIFRGVLAETNTLDERGSTVADIFGVSSLDLVELCMAVEERGSKLNTVGDLMRFMDEFKDDSWPKVET